MDEIDRKILSCLQNNGRISNKELAQRINLVPSAALKRLRRLEETGVISGYACRIDHGKIGLNMNVLNKRKKCINKTNNNPKIIIHKR